MKNERVKNIHSNGERVKIPILFAKSIKGAGQGTIHISVTEFCRKPKCCVMRPFCLVESRSQHAAANAGVLSVYLTTIMF